MNWPVVEFAEVLKDVSGGNIKTKQNEYLAEGEFPIVDQGQSLVGGYTNDGSRLCKSPAPVVVFGDHTKALKFVDFPFCMGADGTKVLQAKDGNDPKYLYYALHNIHIPEAGYSRHFKYLKAGRIPLPPLEEQKRIAGILDQADTLRRLRSHALDKLDTLGRAIFHEMFGDTHSNPKNFDRVPLGDLIKVSSGQGLTSKNMKPGEFPVYGGNGVNGYHDEGPVAAKTIVIGRVGAYCGVVHTTEHQCWVTDNALIVKKLAPANTVYLATALQVAELNQYAGRAAQPLVSGSRIYPVEILLPPANLQEDFERAMSSVSEQRAVFNKAANRVDNLFASLQHRAFRGEL